MGGDNSLDNLRPAHLSCNASRKDMPLDQWFALHPLPKRKSKPSRDW
uniref:HNH endonuclease n=1 Tax=Siphoviridae sp. ctCCv12 TaxID=2826191 RepID=A0A8S5N6A7_9CAUD|nr:MAG TPA: HNH endonuclease [Siphoviridae sp. ctCCv12]